ncbi:MAG: zf-HC2 domain-containing protein, partial [bacterium]
MEHSYFKDRISAFIDGELPPYENQVVGEHLSDCEECQQLKAELEKIDSLIEKHSSLDGDEYWEKSAQKIEDKLGLSDTKIEDITPEKKSSFKGIGWKIASVAASVAVLTFIGLHEKDIFKNIDTTPKMQSPSISLPPPESREYDDIVLDDAVKEESENINELHTERLEVSEREDKKKGIEQEDSEKPKIGIPTPVTDSYLKPDDENKTVMGKGDSATTVEELLSKVAGVVTNTQGEVFVRGGRAGEVGYIVDSPSVSKPEEAEHRDADLDNSTTVVNVEMEPKTTSIDKTIQVAGKQDQLKVYKTANQATITKEENGSDTVSKKSLVPKLDIQQSATGGDVQALEFNSISPDVMDIDKESLDSTQLLVEYVHRKDSLLVIWNEMKKNDRKLKIKSSLQKMNNIGIVEKQLLSSYYDLAVIAKERDEEEY